MCICTPAQYILSRRCRVAKLGSLSSGAKMAMKIFVKRVFTIFAWNMQYIPCNSALLAQETLFLTKKALFLPQDLQKVRKSRQILIRDKIAYVGAKNFRQSPNFSAGAPRAPAQLLPPCHVQTCIQKRYHEKSKNTVLLIELCFHSLRWSTWNFKSTETIDGCSILEFYPSSLPPHLNPKSEWPMYNCGAGRSTPSPIWETSNNFCCQALPQRYPKVQRAPNGTH